jgi:hypothetical protein
MHPNRRPVFPFRMPRIIRRRIRSQRPVPAAVGELCDGRNNMDRTIKLYAKLDELETEFAALLLAEFREIADGRSSRFLDRKIPHLFDGKKWRNAEAGHIERVEQDLRTLREQLGEPIETSSLIPIRNSVASGRIRRVVAVPGHAEIARPKRPRGPVDIVKADL